MKPMHRKVIPVGTESDNCASDDGRYYRSMAKRLARVHIGEMYLDGGETDAADRVPQRDAVVRQRAGIDDHPVHFFDVFVNEVEDFTFVIGLEIDYLAVERCRRPSNVFKDVGEGLPSVYVGLTSSKQVEIRAIHEHQVHGVSCA